MSVPGANESGIETAFATAPPAGHGYGEAGEPTVHATRAELRAPGPRPAEMAVPAVRVHELVRALAAGIRRRPLTSLGVAIGVGFLVGGALSFRAGRIVLAAAARRVAKQVLEKVL